MKNSLLTFLVCLLASSPCWAWTIKIKNGDLAYEGRTLGNEMIYTSTKDGKILGERFWDPPESLETRLYIRIATDSM